MLYAVRMAYSSDFVQTVALVAARAQYMWGSSASPKDAVEFAWFSVNQTGDASIDDHDLARHLAIWAEETGRGHLDIES
jgi:hypothetical protein